MRYARNLMVDKLLHRGPASRCKPLRASVVAAASEKYDYDLVIIGCGVGGHGAALHAVEAVRTRFYGRTAFKLHQAGEGLTISSVWLRLLQGLKVAVIEGHDIGGTCVNRGCVPSKALLAASGRVREFRDKQHLASLGIQASWSFCFFDPALHMLWFLRHSPTDVTACWVLGPTGWLGDL